MDIKMRNKNPASVIKEALAKVLVFYYPLADRLKEGPERKLVVDCSGQGVLFIEAGADVMLKQFGDVLQPPFPCMDKLLYDVPGSSGILDSPLLLIQVTRLLCGGFIFAIRLNQTMSDTLGLLQFMKALREMTHGASMPSTLPVWQRELLSARDPPHVTCNHHEYDEAADTNGTILKMDDMVKQSFFFGPAEITALCGFVPIHLQSCSTFELIITCLWRCRTIALQRKPEEKMRLLCVINACSKLNPPLPQGYYGNVFCFATAISTAQDLCYKPLGHALELVMKAKSNVNEECMKSVADLMVIKGRPHYTIIDQSYLVDDVTRIGLNVVDLGWGKAAYVGPSGGRRGDHSNGGSFYLPLKTSKGERGIVVPIALPSVAMNKFVKELNNMLRDKSQVL